MFMEMVAARAEIDPLPGKSETRRPKATPGEE